MSAVTGIEATMPPMTELGDGTGHPDHSPSSSPPNEKANEPQRAIGGFRWFLVCIAVFSANLLFGLDCTIAADIQGAVSETYDNTSQLGWLGVGFGLGSTVSILPLGKIYSMFNTKYVFISCLVMFAAASALCGAAPTMNSMIVGRVWAGAGGAGMYLGTLNLITVVTTPREASFYIGFEGFIYGTGAILGPVVGGLLADSAATWRWAFYLNLIIFAVMSPVYIFVLPSLPRHDDISFIEKIKKMDWLGTVLSAALYVCFVLAFTFGSTVWSWSDSRFIALVVLFVAFTAAFALTQHFALFTTKLDRLFPCEFVGSLQLVIINISMACGGAVLFISVYYVPLYFLFVQGETGTQSAVRMLPLVIIYVFSILSAGWLIPRIGYPVVWHLVSGILMVAGGAGMYTVHADTPTAYTYGFSVLIGLGLTCSQAGYSVAMPFVKPERAAELIQFINISQGQSQMIGLVIASAIFQSLSFSGLKSILGPQGFSDEQVQAAVAGSSSGVLDAVSPELRSQSLDALVSAIQAVWVLVISAGALQTVISCFMSKKRFY